jgi:rhodanese-related sulfurtransferase
MRTVSFLLLIGLVACGGGGESSGTISSNELLRRLEASEPPLVIDVRSAEEYAAGHVPGAWNLPHEELPMQLDLVRSRAGDEVVVYCQSGRRAGVAEQVLLDAGFDSVILLDGHMAGWRESGHPLETAEAGG